MIGLYINWAALWQGLCLPNVKDKDADKPWRPHILIGAFVFCSLDSIISMPAKSYILRLLSLTLWTGFFVVKKNHRFSIEWCCLHGTCTSQRAMYIFTWMFVFIIIIIIIFFFFFFFLFLFVYMGVKLSVHGQNYGGWSFSPKALKMTCQFWGSPSLIRVLPRMRSAKTVNSGKNISHKMNDKITFISMNCNGFNHSAKRRDVLNFLKSKGFSIYFLQETHFVEKVENYRSQWGFECYYKSFSSQQKGVAI